MLTGLLEIRIQSATLFYQYRNLTGAAYEQIPGLTMPPAVQMYGDALGILELTLPAPGRGTRARLTTRPPRVSLPRGMIRSMTGFGQAEGTVGTARVTVEVRTVNHRFFSPSIKLPSAFARWEADVREAMRVRVSRGHVTLTARSERAPGAAAVIDEARFAEVVAHLRGLQQRYALDGGVDLATVLRMPDVIAAPREEEETGTVAELIAIVERALEGLARARAEEGASAGDVLAQRLDVAGRVARADRGAGARARGRPAGSPPDRRPGADRGVRGRRAAAGPGDRHPRRPPRCQRGAGPLPVPHYRLPVPPWPITGGEPVGKRLGFLLQEMLREANTTGSKGADATILHEVVTVKEELERIREQVENLE